MSWTRSGQLNPSRCHTTTVNRCFSSAIREENLSTGFSTDPRDTRVLRIAIGLATERKDDVLTLVEYFLHRYAARADKRFRSIDKRTLDLLQAYDWPGNIRELQNVIERSVILSAGDVFRSTSCGCPERRLVRQLAFNRPCRPRMARAASARLSRRPSPRAGDEWPGHQARRQSWAFPHRRSNPRSRPSKSARASSSSAEDSRESRESRNSRDSHAPRWQSALSFLCL